MSDLLAIYWATALVFVKFAPAIIIPCLITWRSTDRGNAQQLTEAESCKVIIT